MISDHVSLANEVFTVCIRTENQNQASCSPFGPHEMSVLIELTYRNPRPQIESQIASLEKVQDELNSVRSTGLLNSWGWGRGLLFHRWVLPAGDLGGRRPSRPGSRRPIRLNIRACSGSSPRISQSRAARKGRIGAPLKRVRTGGQSDVAYNGG